MVYRVVIDESGEAGIKNIRKTDGTGYGASPYLTFGAVIYDSDDEAAICRTLEQIANKLKRQEIHCCRLGHEQKLAIINDIKDLDILCFGTISNKHTLREYKENIGQNPRKFYNKCGQYLLEQLGRIAKTYDIDREQIEIIFEEANFDYDALQNYIIKCQITPYHDNAKLLKYINARHIRTRRKNELRTLELADVVAHSLYRCVDRSEGNYGIIEPRYLNELSPKFFGNPDTGRILNYGINCIHSISDLDLQPIAKRNIAELKNKKAPLN